MFEKRSAGENSGNRFIRPKGDGDSIKGIFAGKPLVYAKHWVDTATGKRSVVCTGPGCEYCKQGNRAKKTFRCNFIVEEGSGYAAKVYEAGMSVYDQLSEVGADYDLSKHLLKITRKGQGLDTSYSVIVAPPAHQPTPEKLALITKTPLLDLDPAKDAAPSESDFGATGDAVPF